MIEALTSRPSQRLYLSAIRVAIATGQRPTAMILKDAYAGHRDPRDWDWKPSPGDTDWTTWDFVLSDVYQVIEDYTNSANGQYRWIDESGDVYWDVHSSFSGYEEAIEKHRESRKELKPGESLYATPLFTDEENKPTFSSWIKGMQEGEGDRRPSRAKGARPPTAEELAAMGT